MSNPAPRLRSRLLVAAVAAVAFGAGAAVLLGTAMPASASVGHASAGVQKSTQSGSAPAPKTAVVPPSPTQAPPAERSSTAPEANAEGLERKFFPTLSGIRLTITNTTQSNIAVSALYDGGDPKWQWLYPGDSTVISNSTFSGPDVSNTYVYFQSDASKVKVEGRLHGWFNPDAELTVNGNSRDLNYNQTVTGTANGHNYAGSRADEDFDLKYFTETGPTGRPDLTLKLT